MSYIPSPNGFTISEVLITLGIIGVVAGMTMPAVIKNHQRKVAEVRLQKSYTIISQAFLRAQAKYGEIKDWPDWDNAEEILRRYIAPELNNPKIYTKTDTTDKNLLCFEGKEFNSVDSNGGETRSQYKWLTNVYISTPFYPDNTTSMRLMDGSCIRLNNKDGNEIFLFIDTNGGTKGPNTAGYDLFFFFIIGNDIKPVGYNWASSDLINASKKHACNPKSNTGGMVCAAKVMFDGWKIKYW